MTSRDGLDMVVIAERIEEKSARYREDDAQVWGVRSGPSIEEALRAVNGSRLAARGLKDWGCRARDSVALNFAEGIARGRRATAEGRNATSIAEGSVAESNVALDAVHLQHGAALQEKRRRVEMMLLKPDAG